MRALDRAHHRGIRILAPLRAREVAVHGAAGLAVAILPRDLEETPPADRSLRVAGEAAPARRLVPSRVEAAGERAVRPLLGEERVGDTPARLDEAIVVQDDPAADPALGGVGQGMEERTIIVGQAALLDPAVGAEPRHRKREIPARRLAMRGIAGRLPGAGQPVGGARVVDVHALARVLRAVTAPGAI